MPENKVQEVSVLCMDVSRSYLALSSNKEYSYLCKERKRLQTELSLIYKEFCPSNSSDTWEMIQKCFVENPENFSQKKQKLKQINKQIKRLEKQYFTTYKR